MHVIHANYPLSLPFVCFGRLCGTWCITRRQSWSYMDSLFKKRLKILTSCKYVGPRLATWLSKLLRLGLLVEFKAQDSLYKIINPWDFLFSVEPESRDSAALSYTAQWPHVFIFPKRLIISQKSWRKQFPFTVWSFCYNNEAYLVIQPNTFPLLHSFINHIVCK